MYHTNVTPDQLTQTQGFTVYRSWRLEEVNFVRL